MERVCETKGEFPSLSLLIKLLACIKKWPSLLKKSLSSLTREGRVKCNAAGGAPTMMGLKERVFAPQVCVSLEGLVPQDHFYRHLQQVLDLSFVYDLVRESYAVAGRPSIDPVVFFKLQLVMFFEAIRSERLLMRQVADRLSVRWYIGVRRVTHDGIPGTARRN
jgi:Transposase domain (DUF772)